VVAGGRGGEGDGVSKAGHNRTICSNLNILSTVLQSNASERARNEAIAIWAVHGLNWLGYRLGRSRRSIQFLVSMEEARVRVKKTPDFYYQYSEDFDYRSYLEEKSHFDRIELSIDSGIRRLVASNDDLRNLGVKSTSEVTSAFDRVGAKLDSGFERLEISLDAAKAAIDDLRAVCEYGFSDLSLGLNSINQSLRELLEISRTPDQTWAFEQYSIAQDAFRRNLFAEALDYLDRAIDGHGNRSGYRIEHRFYMLRGLIYLGNYKNCDENVVKLINAQRDFLMAARYAENTSKVDCARSFGLAGWAFYCDGKMSESEANLRKSVELNSSDAASFFDLSKVLFYQGNLEEGRKILAATLRLDSSYGIRAAADLDFLDNKMETLEVIEDYRLELKSEVSTEIADLNTIRIDRKTLILKKYSCDPSEDRKVLEEIRESMSSAPISDLLSYKEKATTAMRNIKGKILSAKSTIETDINNTKQTRVKNPFSSIYNDSFDKLTTVVSVIAAPIGLFLYVSWVHQSGGSIFPQDDPYPPSGFFETVFTIIQPIWALIVAFAAVPIAIGFISYVLAPAFRASGELAKANNRRATTVELESEIKVLSL
jgi:tetratricopeptide (TPR) repeat protein